MDLGLPNEQYSYDAVHNRMSSAHQPGEWQYETGNRLTQQGFGQNQSSYGYSATGHIQSESKNGITTSYHYDATERLVQIVTGTQTIARYQYDPGGRRISKTIGEGASAQTIWYVYSPEGLLAELDASGQISKTYGWRPDSIWGTTPLWQGDHSQTPKTSSYHYLHNDHLNTPQLGSNSAGNITWQALSESFGNTMVGSNSSTEVNIRFPGQYWDAETGLHYNQQRDYNPSTGRYLQNDPIGLVGGINTYAYGYGNPILYTDPDGLLAPVIPYVGRAGAQACLKSPACMTAAAATAAAVGNACVATWDAVSDWMFSDGAGETPSDSPPGLPPVVVGEQNDPRAGTNKKGTRHTSGPLKPEYGGTGDPVKDLEKLTGGTRPITPAEEKKFPRETRIGANGIIGRPENSSGGYSIDIPANGDKPHETLHYPEPKK